MIPNYFEEIINSIFGKCIKLSVKDNPSRFIRLSYSSLPFESLSEFVDEGDFPYFSPVRAALKEIKRSYYKKYVFTHPLLIYTPKDRTWHIKIGMMEKTKWKEILKKRKKDAKHKDKN